MVGFFLDRIRLIRDYLLVKKSGLFDEEYYLEKNPDVAGSGADPVKHFLLFGWREGRNPSRDFNVSYYLSKNSDVASSGTNPLVHFISFGKREGRRPVSPACDKNACLPQSSKLAQYLESVPVLQLSPYDSWCRVNRWNGKREAILKQRLSKLADRPLLCVIMPVYDPSPAFLRSAIESVRDQVYDNWELFIVDDSSTNPEISEILREYSYADERINLQILEKNRNISQATNIAAKSASGDFLVFLDHDDLLTADALGEIALKIAEFPDSDLLYSDDDKITEDGCLTAPQFKPAWSPELLLSHMYISHLMVVRREFFDGLDGMRVGFEGAQDYDFALRAAQKARRVVHVPRMLYHWRITEGSTAASGGAKPRGFEAGRRAVEEAIVRMNVNAKVKRPQWAVEAMCGIFELEFPDSGPTVTIIIPTRNNKDILKRCIDSLKKTTYRNYAVTVVNNNSDDSATISYLEELNHEVIDVANPGPDFNFSHLVNAGVSHSDSEYILLLNDDTEVISPQWLSQMVGYLGISGVGAVGARLLFPDDRIQHAGIIQSGIRQLPKPAFKLCSTYDNGYLSYTRVARNCSAVTAACMLTKRSLYQALGGFDEDLFAIAYNDVDFCYRLLEYGQRVVYCPGAELIHHEGASRGRNNDRPSEEAAFLEKYGRFTDVYYNHNLSENDSGFTIAAYTSTPVVDKPIRTFMCSHNLEREGAPICLLELAKGLSDANVIKALIYSPVDGPLREEFKYIAEEIFPHGFLTPDFTSVAKYQNSIDRIAGLLHEAGIELVHANTILSFYIIEAAERAGIPSVWNIHESEEIDYHLGFLQDDILVSAVKSFAYPYRVVFVAAATQSVYEKWNVSNNFATVHNGIDIERFKASFEKASISVIKSELGINPDDIIILCVGTVSERKGQRDAVDAFRKLSPETRDSAVLLLVGGNDNRYAEDLKNSLSSSETERVVFVPNTNRIAEYYRAADILICCSRVESYPRTIQEGMIAGLPIVTTPVFGIKEQVVEGANALFYNPGDINLLAERLTSLIENESLRNRLAENSVSVLARLNNYRDMIDSYIDIFAQASISR